MKDAYFDRSHLPLFPSVGRGNPELAERFFGYYGAVFADGALSGRMKSLTALSVAHAVQCPYCIDAYTADSLAKGSDLEQMTEAVHVAAWVRSASTLSYGVQMTAQATGMTGQAASSVTDAYFARKHGTDRDTVGQGAPELLSAFKAWEEALLAEAELSGKEKAIVAVAVAHTLQSPYTIERSTELALSAGATLEQLTEAVHVGVAIRGGAALVHAVQMLEQIDQRGMA